MASGKFAVYPAPGERFGCWEVITSAPSKRSASGQLKAYVVCRCVCGTTKPVQLANLVSGHSPSCGCQTRKRVGQMNLRHGKRHSPVYWVWSTMKSRCQSPTSASFHNYGGRGIRVCERWQVFDNFLADMGEPAPGATIERIDNDGNYEPGNCRWATRKEQGANTQQTVRIMLPDALRVSLTMACDLVGLERHAVTKYARLHGVSHQQAFDHLRASVVSS